MKRTNFYLCLLCLAAACGGPADRSTSEAAEEARQLDAVLLRDSLAKEYARYRAQLTDTLPSVQIQEQGRLYPVDEALRDTAFFVYRQRLAQAVANKDVFALLDAVSKNIQTAAAAEPGVAGFVSAYRLDAPVTDTLPIWAALSELLSKGGKFSKNGKQFTAPYYAADWPQGPPSAEQAVVVGTGVRLRSAPSLNSEIVTTVSHATARLLRYDGPEETIGGETHRWAEVVLEDGKQGFVFGKFVGFPKGARAVFEEERPGVWAMQRFER